ncbi:kinase-like domain-containing protein [Gilbertella persicaria]|uniref:kinase-like domain-containing protein n=1 Tax=Gilbertella persicaria TaxID=101096 RepID=UPI00221EFCBD|nr:kinase-like domain-containing protein [Gilbertella persicaria]KAI8091220.1 kinase-like domain-containing protein [Gilbertella persicaria]
MQDDTDNMNYVDYTPRRMMTHSSRLTLPSTPNSLTLAKYRRSYFYQQLARQDVHPIPDNLDFMDSPAVRRHFGISEKVAVLDDRQVSQQPLKNCSDWHIHDFDVGENLGKGKFGSVYKAKELRTGQIVALKILKKKELEQYRVEPFIKREIEIQGHLNHPNITRLYGYFHDKEQIYLVLEYAGDSDLYTCLESHKRFTETETANYILEIAEALAYMHQLGVFHRDIKLENILISKDGALKIADFGWAVYDPKPRRNTFCGTLDYLPPEMIQRQTHGASVDIWALGVLCYELLVGKAPFEDPLDPAREDHQATYQRILKAHVTFPSDLSDGAKHFVLGVKKYTSSILCD